jgi:hypothetical protein
VIITPARSTTEDRDSDTALEVLPQLATEVASVPTGEGLRGIRKVKPTSTKRWT